ncbi:MAG: hypothetical protein KAH23_01905 [Kiritimatiellae bacterium]|nr:hypothetical protein [Kiritimatiellia bacterium]
MITSLHKYLFIVAIFTVAVLPCSAVDITNSIPFTNSFEQYSHNQSIAGADGWSAGDTNIIVVATNASDIYDAFLGELPLTNAAHTKILTLDGDATNKIENSMDEFFIDMMIQPKRWNKEDPPVMPTNAMRTAFYFNTNGHIMVYGSYEDTNSVMQTNWIEMASRTISTGQWIRLTVDLRLDESGGEEWFRVMIDNQEMDYQYGSGSRGDPSARPGPWLQIANKKYGQDTLHTISGITLSGTGKFDDLQVVTNNPAGNVFYNINISITPQNGARVTVANLFTTTASASTPFKDDAPPFDVEVIPFPNGDAYHITGVWYDGAPVNFIPELGSETITINNASNHSVVVTAEPQSQLLTIENIGLPCTNTPANNTHTQYVYGVQVDMSSTNLNPTNNSLTRHSCAWSRNASDDASGETAGPTTVNSSFTITEPTTHTWNWHVEHSLVANKVSQHGTYTGAGGTLNVATVSWHNEGSNAVVIATPAAPTVGTWSFTNWSGDTADSVIVSNQITLTMNDANTNLVANFIYTPNSSNWTLTVASPTGTPDPPIGTISNIVDGTLTNCSINQDIATGFGTQQHCIGWTGTGSTPSSGSTTNTGLFVVTADSSVTWNWETQHELTMTVNGNGDVNVPEGKSWQTANQSLTITATPYGGASFDKWTGTNANDVIVGNQVTTPMSTRRAIAATFIGGTSETTNGTPYTWLAQFNLTNYEVDDLLDQDEDGLFTWEEFITGTDPKDSNSVFAVINIQTLGGTNYMTFYGTTNGVTLPFGIERSTNLITGDGWLLYDTKGRASSGTNLWQDPAPVTGGSVFFRPIATNAP